MDCISVNCTFSESALEVNFNVIMELVFQRIICVTTKKTAMMVLMRHQKLVGRKEDFVELANSNAIMDFVLKM